VSVKKCCFLIHYSQIEKTEKNVVLGFIFDRFVFFREIQSNEQHEKRVNELMKKV